MNAQASSASRLPGIAERRFNLLTASNSSPFGIHPFPYAASINRSLPIRSGLARNNSQTEGAPERIASLVFFS
jgi:hypothetical protein